MSKSYEIYKEAVGEDMKPFEEMNDKLQNAWCAIDLHYTRKPTITESATYELYKSKNKDAKEFNDLPESIKRTFNSLDKNIDKIEKTKKKVKQTPKLKKFPKPAEMLVAQNIF